MKISSIGRPALVGAALFLFSLGAAQAQTPARNSPGKSGTPEQRTARAYDAARANPLELRAFLARMPKGADLHYHLTGGIYAETWIRDAAEDGICVDLASLSFVRQESAARSASSQPDCGARQAPAAKAFTDQNFYDALVDAFSMRSFVASAGVSGHDHFFSTFAKFGGASQRHAGEWLDEIAARAASQNEQYLELMVTPDFSRTARIARELGWRDDFGQLRAELLAHGLRDDIAVASAARDAAEASRRKIEHCGEPQAAPACNVTIRYLYQVLRGFPKAQVFAQTLLGFEVASADPHFVGINYVMPEDGATSMADYALHMKIVGYLHGLYPNVHISLHAGELAEGLVPPAGLCCHIRLAVEDAHAERIGHGVDVMDEDRPYDLLKEMAAKHVMVEINLTSNDVILGVKGKDHPFPIYRKYHVPVALSTDDEGVSRIDLTHEYVRASDTYALRYADLKQMVRTGLEHDFLPGASLWRPQDAFTRPAAPCARDVLGAQKPSAACAVFLKSSEKARQQWELERRFREFEAGF
ncbi:MAG TPA: adenosine deaminase [Candidatus Dormibacteraeota bacterium]|nr:adenosine deaminase [Candidatus Dormibacteraeota bacterium]